jgi:hypothetical protein
MKSARCDAGGGTAIFGNVEYGALRRLGGARDFPARLSSYELLTSAPSRFASGFHASRTIVNYKLRSLPCVYS